MKNENLKKFEITNGIKISTVYFHAQMCEYCHEMVERDKISPNGWRWCCLNCLNKKKGA